MSGVDRQFEQLRGQGRKAFIPFITAGDPNLPTTAALVRGLAESGASVVEVGLPYSDPIADGPVIQASYTRALGNKIRIADIFKHVAPVAASIAVPVVAMTSYAIIYRRHPEQFLAEAKSAGLSGLIVPDLPVDESRELQPICQQAGLSLIQLVTPTTSRERALRILEVSSGFVYYVSVAGITGERREVPPDLAERVGWLREQTHLPVCVGFGISQPDQVRLLRNLADGVIVGSALVRRVSSLADQPTEQIVASVSEFARELAQPLDEASAAG